MIWNLGCTIAHFAFSIAIFRRPTSCALPHFMVYLRGCERVCSCRFARRRWIVAAHRQPLSSFAHFSVAERETSGKARRRSCHADDDGTYVREMPETLKFNNILIIRFCQESSCSPSTFYGNRVAKEHFECTPFHALTISMAHPTTVCVCGTLVAAHFSTSTARTTYLNCVCMCVCVYRVSLPRLYLFGLIDFKGIECYR